MSVKKSNLAQLYEYVRKGSKGFRDDSVKLHLERFVDYASKCEVVTELGIDSANATLAFLNGGCKKLYSYNVVITPNALKVKEAADKDGVFFKIIRKDSLKVKIKITDLLYIDTDHWYGQIKAELEHHHNRVRKWIMMHDTETFGLINPFDNRPGMKSAIYEFLDTHEEWDVKEEIKEGHGLTILERKIPIKKTCLFW